jgi:hypothetical protein
VSDPVPARWPASSEIKLTASFQKVSIDEVFYLSADGSRLDSRAVYDTASQPFAKDLSKIKTDLQPSIGTPGALS